MTVFLDVMAGIVIGWCSMLSAINAFAGRSKMAVWQMFLTGANLAILIWRHS